MTGEEILKKIEELGISVANFAYGDFYFLDYVDHLDHPNWDEYKELKEIDWRLITPKQNSRIKELIEILNPIADELVGIGKWEEVEQKGGMDEGSEWYSVKYFKDHDVYIKTDGYYQSHHGTDFEYGYGKEVKPKEVKITIYS